MTGSETSSAGPVVTPEQALEFVASASALLARSLDYETTLREVARLAVPEVADWCGVLLLDLGDGEREISSGYRIPRSRPPCSRSAPAAARRPARRSRAAWPRPASRSWPPTCARPSTRASRPAARADRAPGTQVVPDRAAGRPRPRAGLDDAALDPRRAPLRGVRPGLRPRAGRALRPGHRQRAPARPRRAIAEPAGHGLLDGPGRPRPRRSRPVASSASTRPSRPSTTAPCDELVGRAVARLLGPGRPYRGRRHPQLRARAEHRRGGARPRADHAHGGRRGRAIGTRRSPR